MTAQPCPPEEMLHSRSERVRSSASRESWVPKPSRPWSFLHWVILNSCHQEHRSGGPFSLRLVEPHEFGSPVSGAQASAREVRSGIVILLRSAVTRGE